MATSVYGIRSVTNGGDLRIEYKNRDSKETVAEVFISPAGKDGQFLAATPEGHTFGYRHDSVEAALEAVAADLRVSVILVDAAHPSVAKLLAKA